MKLNFIEMKNITLFLLVILLSSCTSLDAQIAERTKQKAEAAKQYCVDNTMNTDICILIDMSVHSGKKRMFIWDLAADTLIAKGMCSHGCCDSGWSVDATKSEPRFSNIPESHCGSLGKYKLGARGWSSFGIHVNYKMHGLELTNNKAYERYIVFHSWNVMSNEETFPYGSPESWGCPAVSNDFMRYVDELLKQEEENVLMWIYK
jgi:hypothetical protein